MIQENKEEVAIFLWPSLEVIPHHFAISYWLHRSALLSVGGECTRTWIPGDKDRWGPSWKWLLTSIFWALILCQALGKAIFVYHCLSPPAPAVTNEVGTIASPILHWRKLWLREVKPWQKSLSQQVAKLGLSDFRGQLFNIFPEKEFGNEDRDELCSWDKCWNSRNLNADRKSLSLQPWDCGWNSHTQSPFWQGQAGIAFGCCEETTMKPCWLSHLP